MLLAAELLELSGEVGVGNGSETARQLLESGKAYKKFKAICKAQGRFTQPVTVPYQFEIRTEKAGILKRINALKISISWKIMNI